MEWYNDYDFIFEELNHLLNLIFDVNEIRREREERSKENKMHRKVVIGNVENEVEKS